MTEENTFERLKYPSQHIKWALSHAYAYANEFYEHVYLPRLDEIKSIQDLCDEVEMTTQSTDHVREFYEVMLKVVPHIKHPEHGDSEDRGWYRVWGAIKYNTGYFCKWDMARDMDMAITLEHYGAITKEEYLKYIREQAENLKKEEKEV